MIKVITEEERDLFDEEKQSENLRLKEQLAETERKIEERAREISRLKSVAKELRRTATRPSSGRRRRHSEPRRRPMRPRP